MISLLFRVLFKPWGLVVLGVVLGSLAWGFLVGSEVPLPERAALKQVAGDVDHATKTTRGRSRRVSYDLELTSAGGGAVTLQMPEGDITEAQVRSLPGRQVVALVSDTGSDSPEVWELSADGKLIVAYEKIRQRRAETQEFLAASAPYVGGAGVVAVVAGVVGLVRRRRGQKSPA